MSGVLEIADEIVNERTRQRLVKGFDEAHDDAHNQHEQLATAAGCYALGLQPGSLLEDLWPWSLTAFKPTTPRRDLIKAAALIVAEIERLDREAARA